MYVLPNPISPSHNLTKLYTRTTPTFSLSFSVTHPHAHAYVFNVIYSIPCKSYTEYRIIHFIIGVSMVLITMVSESFININ